MKYLTEIFSIPVDHVHQLNVVKYAVNDPGKLAMTTTDPVEPRGSPIVGTSLESQGRGVFFRGPCELIVDDTEREDRQVNR